MAASNQVAPPPGFVLDIQNSQEAQGSIPTPPEGFQLDSQPTQDSSKSLKYSDIQTKKNPGTPLGIGEVIPGIARGVVQGGQEMLNTVANLNELIGSPAGTKPRDLVNASRKALDVLLPPSDSIMGKISEGVGQVPGMATTYGLLPEGAVLPVAGVLGGLNAQSDGATGMVKGAAGNMLLMGLL